MPYPQSPFSDNFIGDALIPSSCVIENKDAYLKKMKQWLCETPSITTIRVKSHGNNLHSHSVSDNITEQLHMNYSKRRIPIPKVYKHCKLEMVVVEHVNIKLLDLEKTTKEVIVDCKCAAAILRGAHVFAPGVIGMTKDCNYGDKVSIYVDANPIQKCKKGFAKIFESPNKHFIANGRVELTRNELFCLEPIKTGIAIQITDSVSGCPPLDYSHEPAVAMLQNLPSIVVVDCLLANSCKFPIDCRILDMCASPGGKTTHIATTMPPGFLMAVDKTPYKIHQLKKTLDKHCIKNVHVECIDWVRINDSAVEALGKFDAILLDAPCSATGSRPQILNSDSANILGSFVNLQRIILRRAISLLKPFGTLVYSTCSVAVPENEAMVAYALKKFFLELVPALPKIGGDGLPYPGLVHPEYLQRFGPQLSSLDDAEEFEDIESDVNNSIGFFIAKFKYVGQS